MKRRAPLRTCIQGVIKAFGAGVNIDEGGEDTESKRQWNRQYVREVLSMHEGSGSGGVDFLLIANLLSLLTHEAIDLGILAECAAQVRVGSRVMLHHVVAASDGSDFVWWWLRVVAVLRGV